MEEYRYYLTTNDDGDLVARKELIETPPYGLILILILAVFAAILIYAVNHADTGYNDAEMDDLSIDTYEELSGNDYAVNTMTNDNCPFVVMVSYEDLNIREGAGTDTAKTGSYTGAGDFTITEVKEGPGAKLGWGKLMSGAGWICLDYVIPVYQ